MSIRARLIEPDVVPAVDEPEAEQRVRAAIVHLHQYLLGRDDLPDDPEVDQTYRLFTGILTEANSRGRFEQVESYFCKSSGQEGPRDPDPHFTIRAWRAVVTYLLRQREFLYE